MSIGNEFLETDFYNIIGDIPEQAEIFLKYGLYS